MHRTLKAALIIAVALIVAPLAKEAYVQVTGTYTDFNISCNSSTTPVSLIPSTTIKSSYSINPDPSGANAVYIFHYTGTLPASPPANCTSTGAGAGCVKLAAGQPYSDGQNFFNSAYQNFQGAFNQGVGCVIASGGSAVATSGSYR